MEGFLDAHNSVTIAFALGLAVGAAPVASSGLRSHGQPLPDLSEAGAFAEAQPVLEKLRRAALRESVRLTPAEVERCCHALDVAGQRLRTHKSSVLAHLDCLFAGLLRPTA